MNVKDINIDGLRPIVIGRKCGVGRSYTPDDDIYI